MNGSLNTAVKCCVYWKYCITFYNYCCLVLNDRRSNSLPRSGVKIQLLNPPLGKGREFVENEKRRVVQDGVEQTHV